MSLEGFGVGKTGWVPFEAYCRQWNVGINGTKTICSKFRNIYGAPNSEKTLAIGGCSDVQMTRNELFEAAKNKENVLLFYLSNPQYAFIVSLYIKNKDNIFYGIQMTVGKSHSFNPVKMAMYVDMAKQENCEFRLYYLVIESNFDVFKLIQKIPKIDKRNAPSQNDYKDWLVHVIAVGPPQLISTDNE
jgi:hypothetical protein